jgi:hypothetical protein
VTAAHRNAPSFQHSCMWGSARVEADVALPGAAANAEQVAEVQSLRAKLHEEQNQRAQLQRETEDLRRKLAAATEPPPPRLNPTHPKPRSSRTPAPTQPPPPPSARTHTVFQPPQSARQLQPTVSHSQRPQAPFSAPELPEKPHELRPQAEAEQQRRRQQERAEQFRAAMCEKAAARTAQHNIAADAADRHAADPLLAQLGL